jgi:uncharacterized protein
MDGMLTKISSLVGAVLPRHGPTFFDLFDELAGHGVSTARRLHRLVDGFPMNAAEVRLIHQEEHQADAINQRILRELQGTFLPPISAEDVHALAESLDDVVDWIDEVAKQFELCSVSSVQAAFVKQTAVLVQATEKVERAAHGLRQSHLYADLLPLLDDIHRLESLGDDVHHAALARLFDGSCSPLSVLKWKELYGLTEEAIDACETVGHTLRRVSFDSE